MIPNRHDTAHLIQLFLITSKQNNTQPWWYRNGSLLTLDKVRNTFLCRNYIAALTLSSVSEISLVVCCRFLISSCKLLDSLSSLSKRSFVVLKYSWGFPLLSSPRLESTPATCLFVFACIPPISCLVLFIDFPIECKNKHSTSLKLFQFKNHQTLVFNEEIIETIIWII